MDIWDDLAGKASALVNGHIDAVETEPGTRGGPDAAWRGIMRDMLSAAVDAYDGDTEAAIGALACALDQVAHEQRAEVS